MSAAAVPDGLGKFGRDLWTGVTGKYTLRSDELAVLESACFEADLIRKLQDGMLDQPLMVKGSMGQQVINPIIGELKLHRSTQAALLRQLKLPDDPAGAGAGSSGGSRSTAARAAVNTRWASRGGA